MLQIRAAEISPPGAALDVRGEIAVGIRQVWRDPLLRPATLATTIGALFSSMSAAVYVLFATRELGIGPAELGGIVAAGGPHGPLRRVPERQDRRPLRRRTPRRLSAQRFYRRQGETGAWVSAQVAFREAPVVLDPLRWEGGVDRPAPPPLAPTGSPRQ
jgi:hypothetical protein